jgi:hypothetical protein
MEIKREIKFFLFIKLNVKEDLICVALLQTLIKKQELESCNSTKDYSSNNNPRRCRCQWLCGKSWGTAGRSLDGIAGSSPAGGMNIYLL